MRVRRSWDRFWIDTAGGFGINEGYGPANLVVLWGRTGVGVYSYIFGRRFMAGRPFRTKTEN